MRNVGDRLQDGDALAQQLSKDCGFHFDLEYGRIFHHRLTFYRRLTYLCRLEIEAHTPRAQVKGRGVNPFGDARTYYFLHCPDDKRIPILPLGNRVEQIKRANRTYQLALFQHKNDRADKRNNVLDYLEFYYTFSRIADDNQPTRFLIVRRPGDVRLDGEEATDAVSSDSPARNQIRGALWRFMDDSEHLSVQPTFQKVRAPQSKFVGHVPVQVHQSIAAVDFHVFKKDGRVGISNPETLFRSRTIIEPPRDELPELPLPRRVMRREALRKWPTVALRVITWTLISLMIGIWTLASAMSLVYPLAELFGQGHAHAVAVWLAKVARSDALSVLWWSSIFAAVVLTVAISLAFMSDGLAATVRWLFGRYGETAAAKMNTLLRPIKYWIWQLLRTYGEQRRRWKIAVIWLGGMVCFVTLVFTTMQIAADHTRFATVVGIRQLLAYFGVQALFALPFAHYLLTSPGFDILDYLRDVPASKPITAGFRFIVFLVVVQAIRKLWAFTSPGHLRWLAQQESKAPVEPPEAPNRRPQRIA